VVCFDEAYHEFVDDPGYRTALEFRDEHPNLIVMRTFSKIYGLAGARVGYGVAAPSIVETIDKIREPFNVNMMAQIGAYYGLDCDREIAARRRANKAERDFIQQGLDDLGFERAESQANFAYFDCGMPAMEAFELLKRQGVIVRAFGKSRFIRATLGTRPENARLLAALRSLKSSR
jgi:histidinol-phosphate aminotransferase